VGKLYTPDSDSDSNSDSMSKYLQFVQNCFYSYFRCPTDYSIMNVLEEVNGSGQTLHANFEAFKFPTSSVVQFRALVTPCIPRYVCHRVTLWGQQINPNHPV
jgi:hypothetical protein